jgi:hypothetical protein
VLELLGLHAGALRCCCQTVDARCGDDKTEVGTWCGDFNAYWEFGYLMFE